MSNEITIKSKVEFYLDETFKFTLKQANNKLKERNDFLEIILFGGRLLQGYTNNGHQTEDVDIQLFKSTSISELEIESMLRFHIIAGVMEVPPIEECVDLESYIELSNLKVYLPSPEMLVISKLASKRAKDLWHLEETDILNVCNIQQLIEMAEDYQQYVLNNTDPNLNFNSFHKLLKDKGLL